ncbi:MAG: hypothetical protein ABIS29_11020, partial [Vicinamibacterales bacterium]
QSQAPGQAARFFDDVGCLAVDAEARVEGTARYVRLASGGWAAAEAAWFARPSGAQTPMDYGILAFATRDKARAADRDSQARNWPAIVTLVETR